MCDSSSSSENCLCSCASNISWISFSALVLTILLIPSAAQGQQVASGSSAANACPVQVLRVNPSSTLLADGVNVQVKNTSGKTVIGLMFNAALADATEHWKWLHWDFDDSRPIEEFGWNKKIKNGSKSRLSWPSRDLDFEHGGGGALVLTRVLFEDGSVWQEAPDHASCKALWHNYHKKGLTRPVELPFRE